jgi:phosphatidylserine/phosphatidylglycerophosphate/cardiolipin synthase-like enzyme
VKIEPEVSDVMISRLDTLFLAMPISWKGTLQQYAGRLHRLFEGKKEALIFDYIDIHVRMFERMYNRRLSGYASIGYKMKGELSSKPEQKEKNVDIIFDKSNFYPVFSNDINHAKREILIVSPFVTRRRTQQIIHDLTPALIKNVKVTVVTRPAEDFQNKDLTAWQDAIKHLETSGITCFLNRTSTKNLPSSTRKPFGTAASTFLAMAVPRRL